MLFRLNIDELVEKYRTKTIKMKATFSKENNGCSLTYHICIRAIGRTHVRNPQGCNH